MANCRSFLEVDTGAIRHNIETIMSAIPSRNLLAVVKADAYGVGAEKIASIAVSCGCSALGVATFEEALELRKYGFELPVYMLSGFLDDELEEAVRNGIVLPVTSVDAARRVSREALRQQKKAACNIIVDSGMGRVGLLASAADADFAEICSMPALDIIGVYSHFSSACVPEDSYTLEQIALFKSFLNRVNLPESCKYIHFAAFDAINNYPQALETPFNMARCGIGIYGMAEKNTLNLPLKRSLKLYARIVDIREMPEGSCIGYMHTAVLKEKKRIGVVAFGYADGLPLEYSNRARFIVNGKSCPVTGRISMDYTTCDLSGVDAEIGDAVLVFGDDEKESITLAEVASFRHSHDYDVLCSVGKRTERRYL